MSYHRDRHGNEVDENGYTRSAVEGWAKHGIYPPPVVGNPSHPKAVELAKAHRARIAKLSPEEQERHWADERQFRDEFRAAVGAAPTRASSSS